MPTPFIVHRYIFKELIPPFVVNLVFFTFIFLTSRILDITNMVVNYGIGLVTVVTILLYSSPYFLIFVIPLAIMLAVLLSYMHMAHDNEITALKASGLNIYALMPPALLFSLLGALLTAYMAIYGVPWGRLALKKLTLEIASAHIDIGLKERMFTDSFEGVMIYVSEIDPQSKTLLDIFIEDQRDANMKSTVVAPRGRLISFPDQYIYQLQLYNGSINQVDLAERSSNAIMFTTYTLTLDLKQTLAPQQEKVSKRRKEMSLKELKHFINTHPTKDERYHAALLEYHRKFALAFSCIAFAILAAPLGMMSSARKRSFSLGLALIFFLLYYLLLSIGKVFGETGIYPPAMGMWVPNVVVTIIGAYFLMRMAAERPLVLPEQLSRIGRLWPWRPKAGPG